MKIRKKTQLQFLPIIENFSLNMTIYGCEGTFNFHFTRNAGYRDILMNVKISPFKKRFKCCDINHCFEFRILVAKFLYKYLSCISLLILLTFLH